MADEENGAATEGEETELDAETTNSTESAGTESAREADAALRALRSERQMRAAAEKKLKAFEDAHKSETEREREARISAEQERDALRLAMRRLKIASEFNLTPAIADRLRGDDEKSMREDAKALIAEIDPEGDLGARRGGQRAENKDPNAALRRVFGF